jgi:hypothetical protein
VWITSNNYMQDPIATVLTVCRHQGQFAAVHLAKTEICVTSHSSKLCVACSLRAGILNGGVLSTLLDCHGNWTAAVALMDRSCLPKPPLTLTASMLVRHCCTQLQHSTAHYSTRSNSRGVAWRGCVPYTVCMSLVYAPATTHGLGWCCRRTHA